MKKHAPFPLALTELQLLGSILYLLAEFLLLPGLLRQFAADRGITSEAALNLMYYAVNFLAWVGILHRLLTDSLAQAGRRPGRFLLTVCLGFAGYCLCVIGMNRACAMLFPDFANVNDGSILSMLREYPVLMSVALVVLTPVAEECMYRGVIFTGLRPKSPVLAYAFSTLAFCAVHVVGYIGMYPAGVLILCFVQYLPAGLFLAWACERTGSLIAPILIHSAVNLMTLLSL